MNANDLHEPSVNYYGYKSSGGVYRREKKDSWDYGQCQIMAVR